MRFWTSFLKNTKISDPDNDNLKKIGLDPNKLQNDRYSSFCWFDIDESPFLHLRAERSYTFHKISNNRTEHVCQTLFLNGQPVITSTFTVPHYQTSPDFIKTSISEDYIRIALLESSRKKVEADIAEKTCSELYAQLQASTTKLNQKMQQLQELQQEIGKLDNKCRLMQANYNRLKQAGKTGDTTTPNDYRWDIRNGEQVWRLK